MAEATAATTSALRCPIHTGRERFLPGCPKIRTGSDARHELGVIHDDHKRQDTDCREYSLPSRQRIRRIRVALSISHNQYRNANEAVGVAEQRRTGPEGLPRRLRGKLPTWRFSF